MHHLGSHYSISVNYSWMYEVASMTLVSDTHILYYPKEPTKGAKGFPKNRHNSDLNKRRGNSAGPCQIFTVRLILFVMVTYVFPDVDVLSCPSQPFLSEPAVTNCIVNPFRHSSPSVFWKTPVILSPWNVELNPCAIIFNPAINMSRHYCMNLLLTICTLMAMLSPQVATLNICSLRVRLRLPLALEGRANCFSDGHRDGGMTAAAFSPKSD